MKKCKQVNKNHETKGREEGKMQLQHIILPIKIIWKCCTFPRLRCHVIESSKPSTLTLNENAFNVPAKSNEDLHLQVTFRNVNM